MVIFTGSGRTPKDKGPSSSRRRIGTDNAKGEDRASPLAGRRASNSTTRNHDRQSSSSQGNSVRVETKRPRSPLKRSDGSEENEDSSSYHLEESMAVGTSSHKKKRVMSAHSYRILLNRGMKKTKNSGARRICQNTTDTDTEVEDTETTFSQLEDLERPQLTKSASNSTPLLNIALETEGIATSSEDLADLEVKGSTCSVSTVTRLKDSSEPIQRDHSNTVCVVCKHPGIFLQCGGKGCNKNYHIACLDPRLGDDPLGLWLCFCCLRKKMEFGVYSISEGYESIWDAKEEMQKERQYLVKHRGLAHVYNQWIPESKLLLEDPMLLARFKKLQKKQVKMWKHEWKEPHRLLQKRFLILPERAEECACGHGDNFEYCYLEWFVKWKGLGYEHATWEFENSPFLCSVEGKTLISDYERRHEEAKIASNPSTVDKVASLKGGLFNKLPRLPDGFPSELGNDHLDSISSILKCWHKNQNAVLIDDQDRIVKSILFLLNLLPYACQPFLIISTNSSISMWEADFIRLAPSINVVVYNGNREVRKMIQTLEFYEEGGCIMFKVLLTCPNIIVEDLEAFDCIGWEAIIVDDCQKSSVSKHFEEYAKLSSEFRLLLLDGPPKDIIVDYFKLLSFLDPKGQENPINSSKFDSIDGSDSLSILKERLKQYIVYERERKSSKFLEYWVPVQLSEVQLRQYCSILASNSLSLRLPLRADCVEPLLDVLMSIRKCCDHPYLADDSLQPSLTKTPPPVQYLDVGVNASGKLQLLDRILQEMKNRGLRVLILFQSNVGSGRNRLGDILYDFLHQRFGDESFEYVDSCMHISQTKAILQKFNDLRREKFVIVIENRACRPRIKLSSVDAVIIYDSDWNPLNDLKAIRKITIDSPFQQLKIFRLYSPYTVEEKLLILTKEDGGLEVDIEYTKTRFRHSLLSWGASYLFNKFDESQQLDSSSVHPKPFTDNLLLNDVLDLLTRSPENLVSTGAELGSNIVKAPLIDSSYSSNITLRGEKEGLSSFDGDPILFWSKLFDSCSPTLRSTSGPFPRIRRSTQCLDESTRSLEEESFNIKKSRKVGTNTTESLSRQTLLQCRGEEPEGLEDTAVPKNVTPCCANQQIFTPTSLTAVADSMPNNKSGAPRSQPNVGSQFLPSSTEKMADVTCSQQMSGLSFNPEVHTFMKGEIKGHPLCEPGQERSCTKKVQKSAMKENQSDVSKDQGRSNIAPPKLQKLVEKNRLFAPGKDIPEHFLQEVTVKAAVPKIQLLEEEKHQRYLPRNDISKDLIPDGSLKSLPCDNVDLEEGEIREDPIQSCSQTASKELISLKSEHLKKNIDLINTVYKARIEKIVIKQMQEVTEFKNQMEKERQQLLKTLNLESIHPSNIDMDVSDAMKKLQQKFSKKLERFDQHVKFQRKKLTVMQIEARNKEKQLKDQFLENAKMGTLVKSFEMLPLSTTGFSLEKFKFIEQVDADDGLGDATTKSQESIQCHRSNIVVETAPNEGTKQMFLEKQIPYCNLIGPITVESAEQERITSDISAACQSVGPEDELLHTRTPSSQCKFSSETAVFSTESPGKKRKTAVFSSADRLIQIKTPAFQCNNSSVIVVGSAEASSEIQPILPREDQEDIIIEKESLGSQLKCVEAMKSVEPSRTSPDIAETPLFGEAARAHNNLEAKIIASDDCDGVDIASGTSAERCGVTEADGACFTSSLQSEAARAHNNLETKIKASDDCDGVDVASRTSAECCGVTEADAACFTSSLQSEAARAHNNLETKIIASDDCDGVDVASGTSAERCGVTEAGGACFTSSLQSQAYITSLPPALNTAGCKNSASHSQPSTIIAMEIPAVSGTPCEPVCSSSPDVTTPVLDSDDRGLIQVDHSNHISEDLSADVGQSNNLFVQDFMLPVPPAHNELPENTHNHLRNTTVQPETVNFLHEHQEAPQSMPQQGTHSDDPFLNEISRLRYAEHLLAQILEDEKRNLVLECEKELDKVRKKYALRIQDADTKYNQKMKVLKSIRGVVHINQNLAEDFREKFFQNKQGMSPPVSRGEPSSALQQQQQQLLQLPRPDAVQRPVFAPPFTPAATPSTPLFSSPRLPTPCSIVTSSPILRPIASSMQPIHNIPVRPRTNLSAMPRISAPMLQSSVNLHGRSEPRAPAPHLRPFKSSLPNVSV